MNIKEPYLLEGYVTKSKNSNQMKWGCKKCYLDIKDKFGFTDQFIIGISTHKLYSRIDWME